MAPHRSVALRTRPLPIRRPADAAAPGGPAGCGCTTPHGRAHGQIHRTARSFRLAVPRECPDAECGCGGTAAHRLSRIDPDRRPSPPLLVWAETLDLNLDHLAETLGYGETDLVERTPEPPTALTGDESPPDEVIQGGDHEQGVAFGVPVDERSQSVRQRGFRLFSA